MTPTVLHLFAGSGGGALGFKRAGFHGLAALDYDADACADLEYLTGERATCVDLRAVEPADLRRIAGPRRPDVVFTSSPCVGFSGCLPERRSREATYLDFNELAVRGVWLALEAWPEPPPLIVFENVPRIRTRGAYLLDQIIGLLHHFGYATDQRVHDCGEVGGLAQHRQRYLLVARHQATVPAFLELPPRQRVRAIGEVLGPLPSPASEHGDELHRLPLLSPLNWLRLAAIRAGKDWRDLPERIVIGGDPADRHQGKLGVEAWEGPAHTVIGRGSRPGSTWASTADPRVAWDPAEHGGRPDSWGVSDWDRSSLTIRATSRIQTSRVSVADPRLADRSARQNGGFGVEDGDAPAHAILGEGTVRNTRASVADPRLGCDQRAGSYGVMDGDEPAGTIVGHHRHDNGPGSIADPRLGHAPRTGTMGVLDLAAPAPTIRGHHETNQAASAVLDARGWPLAREVLATLAASDDGAWRLSAGDVWVSPEEGATA